ncbi:glutaredoxin family protein [Halomonas korlensis]|uniref:Glutaredoxin n=1 Tax=Halomonas korlensis TaxID=463301 RepID=A0A1I7FK83_9GAMM|nr:Glutaredoxin [Halomonas korlensis]
MSTATATPTSSKQGTARVYRMKTEEHLCPFGLKTVDLLKRKGYRVEDHTLTSRQAIDEFKQGAGVDTTPQVYIGDKQVGGYEEVRAYLGLSVPGDKETTYQPVIAIFATSLLIGLAVIWAASGSRVWADAGVCHCYRHGIVGATKTAGRRKLQHHVS